LNGGASTALAMARVVSATWLMVCGVRGGR
jgi:hypothetical protein